MNEFKSKFKIGDRVRVVEPSFYGLGRHDKDNCSITGFGRNPHVYMVSSIAYKGEEHSENETGFHYSFYENELESVADGNAGHNSKLKDTYTLAEVHDMHRELIKLRAVVKK